MPPPRLFSILSDEILLHQARFRSHILGLLHDRLIAGVGDKGGIKIPEGAVVKICTGKTVIPGMVMLHEHLYYTMEMGDFFNVAEMPYSFPRMYLAGGATTIRTGGSIEPQTDLAINRMIQAGMLIGPDMDVTAMVNFWADRGCTSFKMYTHATREDMIAVAREAHKRHLKVTGHIATLKLTPIQFLVISHTASSFHIPTPSAVTNT